MTKFEEELRNKGVKIFTHMDGCTISKKVFINYADVVNLSEGWVSPEAHQARVDELVAAKEKNIELLRKNATLKSQLQQQALPVVPECVSEWIEILKSKGLKPLKNPETYGETGFTEEKLQNIVFWISEHQEDYLRAWLDGYTVEKPQLFYLKNKLTRLYLFKAFGYSKYGEQYELREEEDFQFTQQEIDSMKIGSYEQIEVTE